MQRKILNQVGFYSEKYEKMRLSIWSYLVLLGMCLIIIKMVNLSTHNQQIVDE